MLDADLDRLGQALAYCSGLRQPEDLRGDVEQAELEVALKKLLEAAQAGQEITAASAQHDRAAERLAEVRADNPGVSEINARIRSRLATRPPEIPAAAAFAALVHVELASLRDQWNEAKRERQDLLDAEEGEAS